MKFTSALLFAAAAAVNAEADCYDEENNWFCGLTGVKQIKYGNLDLPGMYRAVSHMDNEGGCTFEDKPYSGPIAPYDEELSFHVRGPLNLHSFAVYTPSTKSKRAAPKPHSKRHGHQHLHKKHAEEKRGDVVTAVIFGETQTWENNWFGPPTDAPAAATTAATTATPAPDASPKETPDVPKPLPDSGSSKGSDNSGVDVPAGDFERVAYYNAADQIADGLVFLANKGDPALSGTWDTVWGSGLSYVGSDGVSCAASPTVLGDVVVPDGAEIAVYSDKECNGDCGAVRPGAVAHHGWAGANKAFLMEITMPDTGATGWNMNMPATWFLHAAISRTGQYTSCSCWKGDGQSPTAGGCGEADILETLRSGDTKCKSTFHFADSLGDSHFFDRPVSKSIKVAVVFQASSSTASIKILDDTFDFGTSLTSQQIDDLVDDEPDINLFSLMTFGLGSK